jgi:hypothetical protein
VIGGWRKFHNEQLHTLLSLLKCNYNDKVKDDEMGRASSMNERKKKNAYKIYEDVRVIFKYM